MKVRQFERNNMNIFQKLFALIFTPSVSGAVAGIEKAVKNLAIVEAHHLAEKAKADAKAIKAAAKAAVSHAEAELAARVKANISALLEKV